MIHLWRDGLIMISLAFTLGISTPARCQAVDGTSEEATHSSATKIPSPSETSPETSTTSSSPPETVVGSHVSTLATSDLREYQAQPPEVKQLIAAALDLTKQNLGYKYGSADPKNGGMDCSGTVYYLLNQAGLKDVPRDSSGMYRWVWTQGRFQAVVSPNGDSFEFDRLKPGDLLFWTGTYDIDRDPPVTHVMIYLGINRKSGRRVMVGASEGRRFEGQSRYGVSVFDFTMPEQKKKTGSSTEVSSGGTLESRFIGYGAIPGLVSL
jgi:cell wall-associated NlpC family hydrolase